MQQVISTLSQIGCDQHPNTIAHVWHVADEAQAAAKHALTCGHWVGLACDHWMGLEQEQEQQLLEAHTPCRHAVLNDHA